ncbi:hypothetical protein [Streptomyces sp. A1136]|uniref:hypothetical protein n=1 Tax=Streptomyces sp. A1136 TaxID=2563102 RepID=UPI00109E9C0D|nr:hypothetical protein [Streptomyces sp. A1136]THA56618.1 hypothetical protein E6R62_10425 [Streptomyces sp. A1136]
MDDRNTRAAAQHDDRDGTPENHEDRDPTLRERAGVSDSPGHSPAAGPSDDPPESVRTLLDTAAACRPVEEVTALVGLLKETGLLSRSGQEALAAAAVSRSVDDVRHMVTLLGEPPDGEVEAGITLRAAALGRPIEDVALLAWSLGAGPDLPTEPAAAPTGGSAGETPADGPAAGGPPAHDPRTHDPRTHDPHALAPHGAHRESGVDGGGGDPGDDLPEDPGAAPRDRPDPPPPPGRGPEAPRGDVLSHVLRWPVAAALLLCGVMHLPGNLAALPAVDPVGYLPTAVSVLCLGLGLLLAVRDTEVVWRAAAVVALGVVALHLVGGIAVFDPLAGALGGPHAWAGVTTVLCAGAGSVLAGLALMYGPRSAAVAEEGDGA